MNGMIRRERLNPYQTAAVLDESRACVVNANVGSGKTTVLIEKIRYLHEEKGVPLSEMAVLTFTNKAADEIRERLFGGPNAIQSADEDTRLFGTFHSVAMRLLRNCLPVERIGYGRDFMVIDPEEELDLALRIVEDNKLKIKYKNRLKKRMEVALAGGKDAGARWQDDFQELLKLLRKEKTEQNKMSFLDLLMNAGHLLKREKVGVRWVIIDELQDIDDVQLSFIDRFMDNGANLFAVGDPNQVIYSWRGSKWNIFSSIVRNYQAKELSLPINYRSAAAILSAARCFQQNGNAVKGVREESGKIVVKRHYNAFNEALYLAGRIEELHRSGVPYRQIAVFYRMQSQSEQLETVFVKNAIPFEISVKKTIREIPVLDWAVKVFRFSLNDTDLPSAVRALAHPDYGEGMTEKAAARLLRGRAENQTNLYCQNLNWDIFNWKEATDDTIPVKEGYMDGQEMDSLTDKMFRFSRERKSITDAKSCYRYFDFDRQLRPNSVNFQEDRTLLMHFLETIEQYSIQNGMSFPDGASAFLSSSALYGADILNAGADERSDSVRLMTLHASKGLEFTHVFIIGVNQGLIPLRASELEEEEEQRLFFVGITRAKEYLELSYYSSPDNGPYGTVLPGESRYLKMLPRKLLAEDETEEAKVDLQDLKRQILEEKRKGNGGTERIGGMTAASSAETTENQEDTVENPSQKSGERLVRHKRYGIGRVLAEDEMIAEVEFEGYGIKEFMKAFGELEWM